MCPAGAHPVRAYIKTYVCIDVKCFCVQKLTYNPFGCIMVLKWTFLWLFKIHLGPFMVHYGSL